MITTLAPNEIESILPYLTLAERAELDLLLSAPGIEDYSDWLERVSPELNWKWKYLRYIIDHLDKITSGELKKLMLFIPPQHGKTSVVTVRYPVYRLEKDPTTKIIVAAYNQDYANKLSRQSRRIAETRPSIVFTKDAKAVENWELQAGGYFRAVGAGSGATGQGAHLIIIDDPVKDRKEAESPVVQEAIYEWYTDVLTTRLQPESAIILIMTRWAEYDLAGRILESEDGPNWTVISLPAEAEENDPLGRAIGEALCPERYDLEALASRRAVLGNSYYAMYQQRPQPKEGNLFKAHWFEKVKAVPADAERIRYWDKAGTQDGGAYTAGVLVAKAKDGTYYIEDVVRGQWAATERERVIKETAIADKARLGMKYKIWIEQEPGSGGKESAENTIKNLAGFSVYSEHPTGDKVVRAEPFAAQCGAGNVKLLDAPWNGAYINELISFPSGKYKDQVDASSGAFNKLALQKSSKLISW